MLYEVHCEAGFDVLVAELRQREPPYQVVVGPLTEHATPAQRGLWALWMDALSAQTGESRGKCERDLLREFGPIHEYDVDGETYYRASMFSELTKDQATQVMNHVQVVAAGIRCALPQGRE